MQKEWEALDEEDRQALIERAKLNPPKPKEKQEACDRLICNFQMMHQACGQQPIPVGASFVSLLRTKEQPYQRRLTVPDHNPMPLDIGWLEAASYVIIENKFTVPSNAPTELKQRHERHRILVNVNNIPIFQIAPGRLFACELNGKGTNEYISIISTDGDCPVNLTAFPQ